MGIKKGIVLKILTDKALVISLGLKDGVSQGDIVHVIEEGEEITDTESGKTYGKLEYVKGVLHVSHLQGDMSTCAPKSIPKTAESSLYRTVSSDMARVAMENSPYGEDGEKLNVKSSQISGMPGIDPIAVGDTVVVFSD